ncbi:UDP-N-acetylmuramate--L-alanine ligase [Synechococcus sp. CBW1006]|uniref:UDP-N-acetylmuramate--L-alanine ligase n=1 Tax=Synechococcus sp. CBW1006 TaxID=1353138 RepID=UPI0018CE64A1|nr:UDP-N-acetylmuramate--L-alanine ligase [Synechococcus sp. CBW1006]QPN65884.1 UDP-N-acetylmuramate--L-alanine ligase [Synechococcus sp. CBW1006]
MNSLSAKISDLLTSTDSVHLVGILGAGMSSLARLLLEGGWRITGSDIAANNRFATLSALGAQITIGDQPSDLSGVGLVVYSAAIPTHNPDLVHARALGLPIASRGRTLSALIEGQDVISVAGSHGKSTTTAMLAFLLERAGLQPGFMIGEACSSLQGRNACWSPQGPFVNESCEAFRALDFWNPRHCIVTNIDDEHSDDYGSLADLKEAFTDFVNRVPEGGKILLCADDSALQTLREQLGERAEDYGFNNMATWRAEIVSRHESRTTFNLFYHGQHLSLVSLPLAGQHNVLNSLAAIAMASAFGVEPARASQHIGLFQSLPRRWQLVGDRAGVRVYDDIAHHPTEIAATLRVARDTVGTGGRVITVCQPQLASRVSRLALEYVRALSNADELVILPIDHAGQMPVVADARALLLDLLQESGTQAWAAEGVEEGCRLAGELAEQGDLVVTIGPGLARQCAHAIAKALESVEIPRGGSGTSRVADSQAVQRPPARRLQDGFEHQVRIRPAAPCLIEAGRIWSYGEIFELANRVAHCLLERSIGRNNLVVLAVAKSSRFIALLLGVLKAGCAYIPLDPAMRRTKLNEIMHQVGIALVIEDRGTDQSLSTSMPTIDSACFWLEVEQASPPPTQHFPRVRSDDLAYAIFTSGSSGIPRLVGVTHENVCALIKYSTRELFQPSDLTLTPFIDSISFDACVHQIFATLSIGGCLLLEADLAGLLRSREFEHITNLGGTPSVIARLAASRPLPEALRVISLGGEVIPQSLIAQLCEHKGLHKLLNLYGPTETTIFSTVAELLGPSLLDGALAPAGNNIGFPISGATIYLVDEQDRIVADGDAGQILIAGAGVTQGYLGDPVRTSARFTPDRFSKSPSSRVFRTGDIGRRMTDGSIEYLGRMDDQIKVNGVRLDPVEIEVELEAFPGIERAAVQQRRTADGYITLEAFVIARDGTDFDVIRQKLSRRLPAVMVPRMITRVNEFPLSDTGKLLRQELRSLAPDNRAGEDRPVSLDGVERRLLSIWQSALQRPDLTPRDNFFDYGGDSLASMQMVLTVEKTFGLRLSAQSIEAISTVEGMASGIRQQLSDPASMRTARPDVTARILDRQRTYLAAWSSGGDRQTGFVRRLGMDKGKPGLFWCFQGYQEFRALAGALGDELPVFGMRSGHLIMEYLPETIAALAEIYSEELIRWQPEGSFLLGGNCQGATIARGTAQALRARGREVRLLLLMEQPSIWPYDQRVGLIFGRESSHNPFLKQENPEPTLRRAYPQGYELRFITGTHGTFFSDENIASLAAVIKSLLAIGTTSY